MVKKLKDLRIMAKGSKHKSDGPITDYAKDFVYCHRNWSPPEFLRSVAQVLDDASEKQLVKLDCEYPGTHIKALRAAATLLDAHFGTY